MGETVRRTVVVSAVNIRKGGTLTILRQCLSYLSSLSGEYRVIALVHDAALCRYEGIEYIELPRCTRSWFHRLWAEYVSMHRISREIAAEDGGRKVWTWLSLHDSTPRVEAEHREVYCHTAFPFMKVKALDFVMDPKIVAFRFLTRWVYRINVHKNEKIIVQQNWFADGLSRMLGVPREKFSVVPPQRDRWSVQTAEKDENAPVTFLYVSTPDCHKNFETLCKATEMLERETGCGKFRTIITVKGDENRYARYLFGKWGGCSSLDFHGLVGKEELASLYANADCLVFPSRIESWGLPISEYHEAHPSGMMLLSDLPYAHETAAGASCRFFSPNDASGLKALMADFIKEHFEL